MSLSSVSLSSFIKPCSSNDLPVQRRFALAVRRLLPALALLGASVGTSLSVAASEPVLTQGAPLGSERAASIGQSLSVKPTDERYVDPATAEALKARVQRIQALPAELKSRDEVLAEKAAAVSATFSAPQSRAQSLGIYHSFNFHSAFARLFEDRDYDGFHQSFTVTFDADVYSTSPGEVVPVYAELYLSKNGGKWMRYFSTETFFISGANNLDDYEVVTTLASGYSPDHYDVLIDLYEVGYSGIVATISADDTNGLYGLPLESSNYDRDNESVVIVEGGSADYPMAALLALGLVLMVRRSKLMPTRSK